MISAEGFKLLMLEFMIKRHIAVSNKKKLLESVYCEMPEILAHRLFGLEKQIRNMDEQIKQLNIIGTSNGIILNAAEVDDDAGFENISLKTNQLELNAKLDFLKRENKALKEYNSKLKRYNDFLEQHH
jgi:hypothetical protein